MGLTNGQTVSGATGIAVQGIPSGAYAVYFYWGNSLYPFTADYVENGSATLTDGDSWYFYGTRTLKAIAFSASGRILGTAQVQLKGQ